MDVLVERLIVTYSEDTIDGSTPSFEFNEKCCVLIKNLCQDVWPCLAVMGGVNPGFRVGGVCGIEVENNEIMKGIISGISSNGSAIDVQELTNDEDILTSKTMYINLLMLYYVLIFVVAQSNCQILECLIVQNLMLI